MRVAVLKKKNEKNFQRERENVKNFLKPGLKKASPTISADVVAKTRNTQAEAVSWKRIQILTTSRVLNLTDLHSNGMNLEVMGFNSIHVLF